MTSLGAQPILDPFETATRRGADLTPKLYREDAVALDAYDRWSDQNRHPIHKLGGWPNVIQSEMEDHCDLLIDGIDPNTATEAQWDNALNQENDWRLLFQISSSAPSHMEWGDAGTLYVWIQSPDLAQRRFDKTCVILQSG